MDNKVLLALVTALVDDAIKNVKIPIEDIRGPRGLKGSDGNDFSIEDHREDLLKFIVDHLPEQLESNKNLIANVYRPRLSDLTEEERESLRGPRGRNGDSFSFDDSRDAINNLIIEYIESIRSSLSLKFSDLSDEEIESLKGKDGLDGKDGQDFDIEKYRQDIVDELSKLIDIKKSELKLKFSDLSDEDRESIRGRRGQRGYPGRSFSLEESSPFIKDSIHEIFEHSKEDLKLKFSDLSDEEKEGLKGETGKSGKDGRDGEDFVFSDHSDEISGIILSHIEDKVPDLKLKFSDLSDEEKEGLKLKFDHLSDEERLSLKGSRGQRGKKGDDGSTWMTGKGSPNVVGKYGDLYLDILTGDVYLNDLSKWAKTTSIKGPQGEIGKQGLPGKDAVAKDGRDGKDAAEIIDVRVEEYPRDQVSFVFEFSDGTEIETNRFTLPKSKDKSSIVFGGFSGGGGSGSSGPGTPGKSAYEIAVDNGFLGTEQDWLASLQGADGINGVDGINGIDGVNGKSAYELAVDNGFVGTEQDWLASLQGTGGVASNTISVQDEFVEVSPTVTKINFIGDLVKVVNRISISTWNTLDEVTDLESFGIADAGTVDVIIGNTDPALLKNNLCHGTVFVGSFVRVDNNGLVMNAIATSYEEANVVGVVEAKSNPNSCDIRILGKSAPIFTGLDTSLDYFLSDVSPGILTDVVPTIPGHIKLKLGQAFSSSIFLYNKGERVVRT